MDAIRDVASQIVYNRGLLAPREQKKKVFPEPVGSKEMLSRPVNRETSETRCSNNKCINTHISSEKM